MRKKWNSPETLRSQFWEEASSGYSQCEIPSSSSVLHRKVLSQNIYGATYRNDKMAVDVA